MRGELTSQFASAGGATAIPPSYTTWLRAPTPVDSSLVVLPPFYSGGLEVPQELDGAAVAGAAMHPVEEGTATAQRIESEQEELPATAAPRGEAEIVEAAVPEAPRVETEILEATAAEAPPVEAEKVEAAAPEAPSLTIGREVVSVTPATTAAHDLAARLEMIARRLRTDGTAAVVEGMRGDRFDALLAGLFAGYIAARDLDS